MQELNYWSARSNRETGKKFESFLQYLKVSHNGRMDVDSMINSSFGAEFTERLHRRFILEEDAMGEEAFSYYNSIGLKKEIFEEGDYYTRWVLFTPLDMYTEEGKDRSYPLVFSNHGGGATIESDEFSNGFIDIAGKEKFMVAILQNTNWENTNRVLDIIGDSYPLDRERVYMSGFSQGGNQTHSTYFRIPEKITAAAPNGNHFYCDWDNQSIVYSVEEYERLRDTFVPFMQVVGVCDASNYLPLNDWKPRKDWGDAHGNPETFSPAGRNNERDPAYIHDPSRGFRDAARRRMKNEPQWWMSQPATPPDPTNCQNWCIDRINKRMELLGCEPRDKEKCLGFASTPEDELHHILGIYGDREKIESYYGYKHYQVDIFNRDGINAFRLIGVENWPHWQPVTMGRLCWDFFQQFRRDSDSGKIVEDLYSGSTD